MFVLLGGNSLSADESKTAHGPEPQTEVIRHMEARILSRINEVRKEHDLPDLEENELLSRVARDYSRQMLQEDFFSHFGPSGRTVADRVEAAGLQYRWVGENLAMTENINQPAEGLVQDWMDSPSHRKNILDENYRQTGIGIWKEGDNYYFTHVFMRSMRSFQKEQEKSEK
ncbi:MAG: CAP domain-containing protein [Desulfococcaceae bacterium]